MNQLEIALIRASDDERKKEDFYRILIDSDIFIIPSGRMPETRDGKIFTGQTIQLKQLQMQDGKAYTPFFTSEEVLSKFIAEKATYLRMNSLSFFELVKGTDAVLNPGNNFGKFFLKEEIHSILSGDIFKQGRQITIEKETPALVGTPANIPKELLQKLSAFYQENKIIKEAYLAWIQIGEAGEPAHYLIMLRSTSSDNQIFEISGEICKNWLGNRKEIFDFIFDSGTDLSLIVRKSGIRFYRRKLFGFN